MSQTPVNADFAAELAAVEAALLGAAQELGAPLGELVRAQIRRNTPLLRAALVLTVAAGSPADIELRAKRILLASALEMLHVAMHVHRLLLESTPHFVNNGRNADYQDRTFIGGAILAGDYCFSRAAQMAARTDNPTVVKIFARTLQVISEGQLRRLFDADTVQPLDELRELLQSGAIAAAALAGLDPNATQAARELSEDVAQRWEKHPAVAEPDRLPSAPVFGRQPALLQWLADQPHDARPAA